MSSRVSARSEFFQTCSKFLYALSAMAALSWLAWHTPDEWVRWSAYLALGYLWMSMVTFMHDATHNTLCRNRMLSWTFGIIAMIPIFASFIAFKEDHLEHHRYNRSPRDPDAFTMGQRGFLDFLLFYAYMAIGALLSFVHFNFIYPIQRFNRRQWAIHIFRNRTQNHGLLAGLELCPCARCARPGAGALAVAGVFLFHCSIPCDSLLNITPRHGIAVRWPGRAP